MSKETEEKVSEVVEPTAKAVDNIAKDLKEYHDKHADELKKHDGLHEDTFKKLEKSIADGVEQAQKILQLETAINRQIAEAEKEGGEPLDKEYKEAYGAYLRKGDENALNIVVEKKALTVNSDPDGGYRVTPEMSARMVKRIFETSPMRAVATVENIGTDSLELIIDDEEATSGGFLGEEGVPTDTATPQIGILNIPTHEQVALPKASQKLLDDANINVESWLANKIAKKFGRTENTRFITGLGVSAPRGILKYDAWAVAGTYERDALEQVNSGDASLITADGLIDIQNTLIEDYQPRATWFMNRLTLGAILKLKDGQGQYLFGGGLNGFTPEGALLLGKRVMFATDMPVIASNALAVAYGDFGEGYTIVDRMGITILRDPFTSKPFILFYTRKRVGGAVTNFEAIKIQKIAT